MYLTAQQASDKELIRELASQMIQKPVMDIQELRGRVSFNYLINGKDILKLPSHRTETAFWKNQNHNLSRLQEQLKYQIPIPKVDYLNLSDGQIMGLCYPKIDGTVLTKAAFRQLSLSRKIPFFENLSEAMDQLHHVNPTLLPLPISSYEDALNALLLNDQSKKNSYLKNIKNAFYSQGIPLNKTSLCHLDLHAENIVLNDQNQIVGILDWDNLCMGEPFMEFYPNLYKPSDLRILRNIYQQKTHEKINPKAFNILDDLHKQMQGLVALGELTRRSGKSEPKNKPISFHKRGLNLTKNTDCWSDFARD